jgi:hypothetical protein
LEILGNGRALFLFLRRKSNIVLRSRQALTEP